MHDYPLILLIFFLIFTCLAECSWASSPNDLDLLRREIVILNRTKEKLATQPDETIKERQEFISYLNRRIGKLCLKLVTNYGLDASSGLPCPSLPPDKLEWVKREAAKRRLQKATYELQRSLGEFDDLLQEEQETAETQGQQARGSAGGEPGNSGFSTGGNGQIESQKRGQGQQVAQKGYDQAGRGHTSYEKDGEHGSYKEDKGTGTLASGRQSSSASSKSKAASIEEDDDIVARQLREAAEKETDPELKKRLWEEYRRYKEGQK